MANSKFNQFSPGCCCDEGPCSGNPTACYTVFGCVTGLEGVTVYLERISPSAATGLTSEVTDSGGCVYFDLNQSWFTPGLYRAVVPDHGPRFTSGASPQSILSCVSVCGGCPTGIISNFTIQLEVASGYVCCNCNYPWKEDLIFTNDWGSITVSYNNGASLWQGSQTISTEAADTYCCDCLDDLNNPEITTKTTTTCSVTIDWNIACDVDSFSAGGTNFCLNTTPPECDVDCTGLSFDVFGCDDMVLAEDCCYVNCAQLVGGGSGGYSNAPDCDNFTASFDEIDLCGGSTAATLSE